MAFDHDLAIRKAIDRALRQHNVKVDVVMAFDNVETIKQAIGINAGLSILPRPTVRKELGMRTLAAVPVALPGLVRPIGDHPSQGEAPHAGGGALHRAAPEARRCLSRLTPCEVPRVRQRGS